jgi:hypothetical protein
MHVSGTGREKAGQLFSDDQEIFIHRACGGLSPVNAVIVHPGRLHRVISQRSRALQRFLMGWGLLLRRTPGLLLLESESQPATSGSSWEQRPATCSKLSGQRSVKGWRL